MSRDKYMRKPPTRRIRDRVLVMCGGETEEIYFNFYKAKHKSNLNNVSIKIVTHKKSNPSAVVNAALDQRAHYDEIWTVFDKDDFADFDNAVAIALNSGINCAFSNEAIEYWFFLHFENRTGAMSRNTLNTELAKNLGFDYDKGAETIKRTCSKLNGKILSAEERAQIGHERHVVDSGKNPSDWRSCTTVYALTKRLREWSKAKK